MFYLFEGHHRGFDLSWIGKSSGTIGEGWSTGHRKKTPPGQGGTREHLNICPKLPTTSSDTRLDNTYLFILDKGRHFSDSVRREHTILYGIRRR